MTVRIVIILYEASSFSTRHPDRLGGKSKIGYKRRDPYSNPLVNIRLQIYYIWLINQNFKSKIIPLNIGNRLFQKADRVLAQIGDTFIHLSVVNRRDLFGVVVLRRDKAIGYT